ncbi:MAG: fructose-bisphosphate aldolase, class I [archaeon GW2011_AR3]|nr:MAG: fructose-bisphosphate aldolase, class I [archaeon GW2011_AR3]
MEKPTLARNEINVPADVPAKSKKTYVDNYYNATHGTGRLMLFAGDQKIEHLNDDFYGTADTGQIPPDDADPEHLFRIASRATIGIFASQLGLIAKYGPEYKDINYIVKLNSKSHMVKTDQKDPRSMSMWTVQDAVDLRENAGLKIVGIGYTIYLGSEYEGEMLREAAQAIKAAHENGMFSVIWMYPRGKAVKDEKDPHLIAGATGVAACIGADFVKVNPPKKDGADSAELLKEATLSAGNRTRVICAGGSSVDPTKFLETLHRQIHIGGVMGNATGRNIHQKPLLEAIRLCNAISSITLGNFTVEKAIQVYEGKEKFAIK